MLSPLVERFVIIAGMAEPGEPLSDRELDVLNCVAQGASNKEAAQTLSISHHTVKVHLRNIYTKLEVSSRTEAVTVAIQAGTLVGFAGSASDSAEISPDPEPPATPPAPRPAPPAEPAALPAATVDDGPRARRTPLRRPLLLGVAIAATVFLILAATWLAMRNGETLVATSATPSEPFVETPIEASRWAISRPLPTAVAGVATVNVGLDLYQIGGQTADGLSNATYIFNTRDKTWLAAADKPTPVVDAAAAVLAGQIYVVGGTAEDGPTQLVEAYSPVNDAWRAVTSLPVALSGAVAVADDNALYVFGGRDADGVSADTAFAYTPNVDSWRPLTSMSEARAYASGGLLQNQIIVAGGERDGAPLASCELYNLGEEQWSRCPDMLLPRSRAQGAVVLDHLYVFGGSAGSDGAYSEFFNSSDNVWQVINTPMLSESASWTSMGTAAIETRIYAMGGRINGALSDQNYVYAPQVYQFFIPATSLSE